MSDDDLAALISDDDLAVCERVVRCLQANRASLEHKRFRELRKAAAVFAERIDRAVELHGATKKRRTTQAQQQRQLDANFRNNSELRQKRINALSALTLEPTVPLLTAAGEATATTTTTSTASTSATMTSFHEPQACYVCKRFYTERHHFYDALCPPCSALNWFKRNRIVDLTGKTILLTGGRIKVRNKPSCVRFVLFCACCSHSWRARAQIGREAALRLLRCGATVHVTTRFVVDCAKRCVDFFFRQRKETTDVRRVRAALHAKATPSSGWRACTCTASTCATCALSSSLPPRAPACTHAAHRAHLTPSLLVAAQFRRRSASAARFDQQRRASTLAPSIDRSIDRLSLTRCVARLCAGRQRSTVRSRTVPLRRSGSDDSAPDRERDRRRVAPPAAQRGACRGHTRLARRAAFDSSPLFLLTVVDTDGAPDRQRRERVVDAQHRAVDDELAHVAADVVDVGVGVDVDVVAVGDVVAGAHASNAARVDSAPRGRQVPLVDGDNDASAFPAGVFDVEHQQVDLRTQNRCVCRR